MQLRNQVEWALHACAALSALPRDARMSTATLAEMHGVPRPYLSKALQSLSRAGIIDGTLGPAGGYRLARAPKDISFLDMVEAVEGRRATFACTEIRRNNPCRAKAHRDAGPCAIARVMAAADDAWRSSLRAVSLADVCETFAAEADPELLRRTVEWALARR
jgi:Rrf2 family protein